GSPPHRRVRQTRIRFLLRLLPRRRGELPSREPMKQFAPRRFMRDPRRQVAFFQKSAKERRSTWCDPWENGSKCDPSTAIPPATFVGMMLCLSANRTSNEVCFDSNEARFLSLLRALNAHALEAYRAPARLKHWVGG